MAHSAEEGPRRGTRRPPLALGLGPHGGQPAHREAGRRGCLGHPVGGGGQGVAVPLGGHPPH
eukprot:6479026-Alexandrium_andersonii.AAC.1